MKNSKSIQAEHDLFWKVIYRPRTFVNGAAVAQIVWDSSGLIDYIEEEGAKIWIYSGTIEKLKDKKHLLVNDLGWVASFRARMKQLKS